MRERHGSDKDAVEFVFFFVLFWFISFLQVRLTPIEKNDEESPPVESNRTIGEEKGPDDDISDKQHWNQITDQQQASNRGGTTYSSKSSSSITSDSVPADRLTDSDPYVES